MYGIDLQNSGKFEEASDNSWERHQERPFHGSFGKWIQQITSLYRALLNFMSFPISKTVCIVVCCNHSFVFYNNIVETALWNSQLWAALCFLGVRLSRALSLGLCTVALLFHTLSSRHIWNGLFGYSASAYVPSRPAKGHGSGAVQLSKKALPGSMLQCILDIILDISRQWLGLPFFVELMVWVASWGCRGLAPSSKSIALIGFT